MGGEVGGGPGQAARRGRREFVRRHHPDRGGDPAAFRRGLAAWDAAVVSAVVSADNPTGSGTQTVAEAAARAAGRLAGALWRLPHEIRAAYREGRRGTAP